MKKFLLIVAGICVAFLVLMLVIGFTVDVDEGGDTDTGSRPVNTPANTPVSTPTIAHTKIPVGLGVERGEIEDLFSASEIGFEFEDSPLRDGTPRRLGDAPNGLASIELIGPESDLSKVSLMMGLAPETVDFNFAYSVLVLTNAVPGWDDEEALKWLGDSMQGLSSDEDKTIETTHGNARITLSFSDNLPFLFLYVSAMDNESAGIISPTETTPTATVIPDETPTVAPVATLTPTVISRGSVDRQTSQQPTLTPEVQSQEVHGQTRLMPGESGVVGGTGEDALAPGLYEYRDHDGGERVTGQRCTLLLNVRATDRIQRRWIELQKGRPFEFRLEARHGEVYLDGGGGPYHDGCTDTINVLGEGLYRIGP